MSSWTTGNFRNPLGYEDVENPENIAYYCSFDRREVDVSTDNQSQTMEETGRDEQNQRRNSRKRTTTQSSIGLYMEELAKRSGFYCSLLQSNNTDENAEKKWVSAFNSAQIELDDGKEIEEKTEGKKEKDEEEKTEIQVKPPASPNWSVHRPPNSFVNINNQSRTFLNVGTNENKVEGENRKGKEEEEDKEVKDEKGEAEYQNSDITQLRSPTDSVSVAYHFSETQSESVANLDENAAVKVLCDNVERLKLSIQNPLQ